MRGQEKFKKSRLFRNATRWRFWGGNRIPRVGRGGGGRFANRGGRPGGGFEEATVLGKFIGYQKEGDGKESRGGGGVVGQLGKVSTFKNALN